MRLYIAAFMVCSLLLTACNGNGATRAVQDLPPIKSCALTGFSCLVLQNNPKDIGIEIRNNGGTDLSSAVMTMETGDCVLAQSKVSIGRVPAGASTVAHFTCSAPPADLSGTLTLTYTLGKGTEVFTREGTVRVRG